MSNLKIFINNMQEWNSSECIPLFETKTLSLSKRMLMKKHLKKKAASNQAVAKNVSNTESTDEEDSTKSNISNK